MKRDYWPTKEWQTADPASVGIDAGKFSDLERLLITQYKTVDGIVVVRNGYLVFERYNNGYGPQEPHNVASVTKSFISALIGIAIDAGYIESIDQKVLEFFPEYVPDGNDVQKQAITIRHLLTMTAPFAWRTKVMGYEPLDRLRRQHDWVVFILDLLGRNGQPGEFQYSSVGVHLLSAIITRITGTCAREFANEHLFRSIGIKEIPNNEMNSFMLDDVFGKDVKGWISDPGGNTIGGWGMTITPRDMVRFGFLYLNHGSWENEQVISKSWVDESTAPNANDYGYLWWLKEKDNVFTYSAAGYGGNHIYCVPGKDLVVAVTSKLAAKSRDRWLLMDKYILPAVIG